MPWGHFAVVFFPYLAYRLIQRKKFPSRHAMLFLLFSSQLPDLIDKPLAWGIQLLPSGRSLAHSLFFAIPLILLVTAFFFRRGRPALGTLFTFGYLSHVFGDIYNLLLTIPPSQWRATYVASLYWPLVSIPEPDVMPLIYYFTRVSFSRYVHGSFGIVLFSLIFFYPEIAAMLEKRRYSMKLIARGETMPENEH